MLEFSERECECVGGSRSNVIKLCEKTRKGSEFVIKTCLTLNNFYDGLNRQCTAGSNFCSSFSIFQFFLFLFLSNHPRKKQKVIGEIRYTITPSFGENKLN